MYQLKLEIAKRIIFQEEYERNNYRSDEILAMRFLSHGEWSDDYQDEPVALSIMSYQELMSCIRFFYKQIFRRILIHKACVRGKFGLSCSEYVSGIVNRENEPDEETTNIPFWSHYSDDDDNCFVDDESYEPSPFEPDHPFWEDNMIDLQEEMEQERKRIRK